MWNLLDIYKLKFMWCFLIFDKPDILDYLQQEHVQMIWGPVSITATGYLFTMTFF